MSFNSGIWWPWGLTRIFGSASAIVTLDATGEYLAVIGRIIIDGKSTGKTLDTSGSSSIRFHVANAPVFDNASSVFTVGFQGVDKTTGFPVRPDGIWSARAVISTAADTTPTLTTTSTAGHVVIPTAGTITLNHGDEVCFVMQMTTRAGSDSVQSNGCTAQSLGMSQYPCCVTNVSGSPASSAASQGVLITFSDGTKGFIEGSIPGQTLQSIWADATNPDEQGLLFQVPFACKIDAISFPMRLVDATSDFQFDITSTPLTSPGSIISGPISVTAENLSTTTEQMIVWPLPSEISLTANTDYCLSVKATGAGNIRWTQLSTGESDARKFLGPAGTTIRTATRNGGSGPYTDGSTTVLNPMSVRISEITTGGGGGGPTDFPVVAATAITDYSADQTSHVINLPASIAAGDLLLLWFTMDNAAGSAITTPSGWTLEEATIAATNTDFGYLFSKVASGSEGSTVTVTSTGTSQSSAAIAVRLTDWDALYTEPGDQRAAAIGITLPPLTPIEPASGVLLTFVNTSGSRDTFDHTDGATVVKTTASTLASNTTATLVYSDITVSSELEEIHAHGMRQSSSTAFSGVVVFVAGPPSAGGGGGGDYTFNQVKQIRYRARQGLI